MNRSISFAIAVLFLALSFPACKSKKALVQKDDVPTEVHQIPSDKALLLQSIGSRQNDFSYYNARGSMTYTDPNESHDLDVNIVMEKDRYIYMNVTALLGINVARVWITKDSISILDLLHRKHIVTDYRYIKKMTNVDLDLRQLQNVFIGNAVFQATASNTIADTVLSYILLTTQLSPAQSQTTYYRKEDLKVTRNLISEKQTGRELRIEYTESYNLKQNSYPKDFDINIRAEKNVECKFRLFNFAFEKTKDTWFVVPKNFETVRM